MVAAPGGGVAAWVLLRIVFSAGAHSIAIAEEQQKNCASSADCAPPRGVCVNGVCQCVGGYSGTACEVAPDRCLYPVPVRCGTGSRCVDGECIRPDLCDGVACGEHGRCEHGICACADGYSGVTCSDVDECASQPCRNGGTCHHSADVRGHEHPAHEQLRAAWVGRHVCACASGYAGVECQCLHCGDHGACQFDGRCICDAGFVGAQCEINIDECASDPCKNDGACEDLDDAYRCTCLPGFAGERCQTDVDECASQPCAPHGSCVDEVDGYSCACRGDFIGKHCTVDCSCGENGEQRDIAAAREAGDCSAGYCFCTGGNAVGEYCEESCGEHGISNGQQCSCSEDWIGERCDTQCSCGEHGEQADIAAARSANDCSAGRCECTGDYIGQQCETQCSCGPHGTQTDIAAARAAGSCAAGSCVCTDDFIGPQCGTQCGCGEHGRQTGIEAARAAGSCSAGSCACHDNWTGDLCDVPPSACLSDPCLNGGECESLSVGQPGAGSRTYRCHCPSGWSGADCQNHVCNADPCANGGKCVHADAEAEQKGRNFSCKCVKGWSGVRCQDPPDPCQWPTKLECGEHGSCTRVGSNDAQCKCAMGWRGRHCEIAPPAPTPSGARGPGPPTPQQLQAIKDHRKRKQLNLPLTDPNAPVKKKRHWAAKEL